MAKGQDSEDKYKYSDNSGSERGRTGLLDRRDCLKLGGVAAATTLGAGFISGTAAAETVHGMTFDRTVNVVDDLGVDPNGNRAVDDAIRGAATDGTLLVFPAGEYLWTGTNSFDGGTIGFQGQGDVRFTVPQGFNDYFFNAQSDEVLFENIDIDIRGDDTVTGMKVMCPNGFHVENVEYIGRGTHSGGSRIPYALVAHVESADATGVVKNLVATQGSAWAHYNGAEGRIGIYAGGGHRGTLRIVDCRLEEFGNNGIYANDNTGTVQVEGGVYRNNNIDAIRIGGAGSYVDGALIEVDPEKYTGPHTKEDSSFNMRGIVVAQKPEKWGWKDAGAEIRNCTIRIAENPSNSSAAINVWHSGRTLQVTDTDIEIQPDRPAIRRDEQESGGSRPSSSDPRWVRCDNVSIVGPADGGAAVDARDANGSAVTNSCIQQSGDGRTGVRFQDSANCEVSDSTVNVSGTTVAGSDVTTTNVSTSGTCSIDSGGSGDGNESPTASFSVSPTSPTVDETVTLDGSGSSDPDGSIQSYAWTVQEPSGSTTSLSGQSPTFTPGESGSYSISLTVTDGGGLQHTTSSDLSVASDQDDAGGATNTLEVVAAGDADMFEYEFTADGPVTPVSEAGRNSAEGNDAATDNEDGTYTGSGAVGNGWGDTFAVEGSVLAFAADTDAANYTLWWNGEQVSASDLGGSDDGDSTDGAESTFEIIAASDADMFEYEFTADGPITLLTDAGRNSAEGNDEVTDNGDGTYTGSGAVGNGWGDAFAVEGDVQSLTIGTGSSDYTLRWNGERVSANDLGGSGSDDTEGTLEVIAAEESGGAFDYGFTADGPIALLTDVDRNSAEGNDEVTDNGDGTYTLSGVVGSGYGDSFGVEGSVLSFDAETDSSNYTLRWNGEQVSESELTDR